MLLVSYPGMAGAKFTSYARTARNRTSRCLFFLETGTENCTVVSGFLVPNAHCDHSRDKSISKVESHVNSDGVIMCDLHRSNTEIT